MFTGTIEHRFGTLLTKQSMRSLAFFVCAYVTCASKNDKYRKKSACFGPGYRISLLEKNLQRNWAKFPIHVCHINSVKTMIYVKPLSPKFASQNLQKTLIGSFLDSFPHLFFVSHI